MKRIFIQHTFSVCRMVFKVIKQMCCYEYIFKAVYLRVNHGLHNIVTVRKESLLSLDCVVSDLFYSFNVVLYCQSEYQPTEKLVACRFNICLL
jgi:hypothetical protein